MKLHIVPIILLLISCEGKSNKSAPNQTGCPESDLLVCGQVVHDQTEPYSHPGDFEITPESHVRIILAKYIGEDAPTETVMEVDSPVSKFPIPFALTGSQADFFANDQRYTLRVKVYSKAGNIAKVGDLVNEYSVMVEEPTRDLTVRATGLEKCSTPSSGGFCTDQE